MLFDGVDDYVDFNGQLSLFNDSTNAWTVKFKFFYDGGSGVQRLFAQQDGSPAFSGVSFYANNNNLRADIIKVSGDRIIHRNSGVTLVAATEYEVVVTYDGSKSASGLVISVDGNTTNANLEDTLTTSILGSSSNLSAGVSSLESTPANFLTGSVWDIEVRDGLNALAFKTLGNGINDANWDDSVGALDGTVFGNPVIVP